MARNKGQKIGLGRVLLRIFGFFFVSALCGVLIIGFLAPVVAFTSTTVGGSVGFYQKLPSELNVNSPSLSSTVVAADGTLIATFFAENRVKVPLEEMSPFIREAIIAIEDNRFYDHAGVDAQGIIRALTSNLTQGTRQGASTLTQQYVTNVLNESRLSEGRPEDVVLSGQKTVGDKLREIKLALELEKRFSKDQILEGYLNIVFFNRNAYGIEAASRYFFSTSASDLTLPQAALLAGLVNGPSIYDPFASPDAALARRNLVLDRMLEQGKITPVDHGVAVATPIELNITPSLQGCAGTTFATYFCDYVSHLILNNEDYGATLEDRERLLYRGGLTITTTLDSRLQNLAQQQVDASAGANPDKWGAAMTTVQPGTGKILAMAQNTVFVPQEGKYDTQLNFNVDAKDENGYDLNGAGGFQPGSTMKPFIYAEWLNEGKNPTAVVDASRRVYPVGFQWRSSCGKVLGGYSTAQKAQNLGADDDLQNNDDGYYRPMPINYGLYNSINTATFATAAQLDFCGIQKMVDAVGLHSGLDNAPINMHQIGNLLGSIGVAPMVLANAYATFANDGTYCKPIAITGISDSQGREYEPQTPECREAVKPAVARGVNAVLQDVLKVGSGVYIEPKVHTKAPVAAKTGTSNNNGATWIAGYTTSLATASFFGDTSAGQQRAGQNITINGKFYKSLDGYMIAGPQWANYMTEAVALYPSVAFPAPPAPPAPTPSVPTTPQPTRR
ncbi:transglycosylase domain-containing protein [Paenarthrobacter aurescens]|uniref:Carboxypeptidase n=1 Tax=Paenarthrobacter aurescens TaxID=43663 RepID=A0A4Y3N700_PAEAU|nr:transglycosylase domain-containing protein [Paenarthrobacter aurescens]UKA49168.1 transglycosylase domain-containing protein [Arthrobacter sp. FW305-123]MDO6144799.1 transglycosylase domain-containing protein [Paenarthrobacter aurescens]MDO6148644.1 transglycosylase domain-containing protein [Paenarthrobacter aurescens]MDO6159890.1 transglycosylase domain-containing protein [Paenarthrobacter aurescens]MDO6163749.1 transglycosylase domain-containing protein [Paenarthrobacter aurescens]